MKAATFLFAGSFFALAAGVAVADSSNWSAEKANQVDINRNSNAGPGNDGERQCSTPEEIEENVWCDNLKINSELGDFDPGNSYGNANNKKKAKKKLP